MPAIPRSSVGDDPAALGRDAKFDARARGRKALIVLADRNPDDAATVEAAGHDQLGAEEFDEGHGRRDAADIAGPRREANVFGANREADVRTCACRRGGRQDKAIVGHEFGSVLAPAEAAGKPDRLADELGDETRRRLLIDL